MNHEHDPIYQAVHILRSGGVVAIPTETVYGLAANATNPIAVDTIFTLKQRPRDNPLIVHISIPEQIEQYAYVQCDLEKKLIQHFMPGPLTVLLRKKPVIPDITTAGNDYVGIRIPAHPITQQILQKSGLALAAPSANISGKPSPTTAAMVRDAFLNKIFVVDGGPCFIGIESTVVRVQGNAVYIYRPGRVTPEDIHQVLGPDIQIHYVTDPSNLSPGTKYKHYAPKAIVQLLPEHGLPPYTEKAALIVTDERLQNIASQDTNKFRIYRWGSIHNLLECAQKLYQLYHQADKENISIIYIEQLPETNGIARAIMNRVKKSIIH